MDEKNKASGFLSEEAVKAVSIALVIIFLFSAGTFLGKVLSNGDNETEEAQSSAVCSTAPQTTTTQPAVTTTLPPATTTTAPATQQTEPTAPVTGEAQTTAADSTAPSTKAEIIAYFNETANKVKTDAVKVVKNYEDRTHNEEHLIAPDVVKGMAADLIAKYLGDDTEPIEYTTREDIVAQYQVPGVEWSSQLTEAEVAEATLTDNGTEYEIMIKLHPTENPEPGQGVAKAFDTITSSEVMEKAPSFVTGFTTSYTDCIVKCAVDKQTGHTTRSNYTSTVILGVKLDFFGELDAQICMTFEKDYTITY